MPWKSFETIETPDEAVWFFEENFADAVPLIGKYVQICNAIIN